MEKRPHIDYNRIVTDRDKYSPISSTTTKQKLNFGVESILGDKTSSKDKKACSPSPSPPPVRPSLRLSPASLSPMCRLLAPSSLHASDNRPCDTALTPRPPLSPPVSLGFPPPHPLPVPRPVFPHTSLLLPQLPPVSLGPASSLSMLASPFMSHPGVMSPWYPVRNYPGLGLLGGIPGLTFGGSKRKKSWTRAVFSNLQRKGLEKRFQIQKYITKPDRRQLAASLGLTDAQVKVWFQNRRMKWRHQESKERREGRIIDSEEAGWTVTSNVFEDEDFKSEDEDEEEVCPVLADSTVDKDGII